MTTVIDVPAIPQRMRRRLRNLVSDTLGDADDALAAAEDDIGEVHDLLFDAQKDEDDSEEPEFESCIRDLLGGIRLLRFRLASSMNLITAPSEPRRRRGRPATPGDPPPSTPDVVEDDPEDGSG